MIPIPDEETSYWLETITSPDYPPLAEDIEVDAVIVGGGIAGLTAAYLLMRSGKRVAVLEKGRLAGAVTGHTTGKVTSQHGLVYAELVDRFGRDGARSYGQANQAALEEMQAIITMEGLRCDWRREDNYVFTEKPEEATKLRREALVAQELDLPASFESEVPLPFQVQGAVRFADQATMHARKYVLELARVVRERGGLIFENTKVTTVHNGQPCTARTTGGSVTASDVIVATNVPFPLVAHGLYCALEYPLKSYVVAGRPLDWVHGMYITPGNPTRSILPVTIGNDRLLLVGGESHVPGLGGGQADARYKRLAEYARERFGIEEITYKWSTMDYLGYDKVPLIGRLYPWTDHIYVATAFMKWGLTNSTVAAMILRDLILKEANPWAKFFDSNRLKPIGSIPRVAMTYVRGKR